MAGPGETTTGTRGKRNPAPQPANDQDVPSLTDLARAILAKEIRPRAMDIRRLAEAVLAGGSSKPKKLKKVKNLDAIGKKKGKSESKKKDKKNKLAKIPGQRAKN